MHVRVTCASVLPVCTALGLHLTPAPFGSPTHAHTHTCTHACIRAHTYIHANVQSKREESDDLCLPVYTCHLSLSHTHNTPLLTHTYTYQHTHSHAQISPAADIHAGQAGRSHPSHIHQGRRPHIQGTHTVGGICAGVSTVHPLTATQTSPRTPSVTCGESRAEY